MANNDKGGCLLPLIIYIAFITLIACCWGVIYYWIHGGTPSYSVSVSTSSIALQAVPGHNVDLGLTGGSLQGNWASDGGLTLTLNGTAFQLVESKSPDWGDSIEYCSGAGCQNPPDNFTIPASFTLPSSYTPGATESGTLTGDLITPQGAGGGNFQNETQTLSIPVTVQAVASFSQKHEPWGRYALITLGVLVVAGALSWKTGAYRLNT